MAPNSPLVTLAPVIVQSLPRLTDYFGVWLMQESAFDASFSFVKSLDLSRHIAAHSNISQRDGVAPPVRKGQYQIAQINLVGTLMKSESSVSSSTSTVMARRAIRAIADDASFDGGFLFIESPGGAAAGTPELSDAIDYLRSKKPVMAYIEDLGCSAAYWLASRASKIGINRSGLTGSIGTLLVVHDLSKLAENEGVKVHVLKRGAFKGTGVLGTEITDDQLKYLDGIVGSIDSHFKLAVSSGRNLSVADINNLQARTLTADEAMTAKLVDFIGSYDDAMAQLVNMIDDSRRKSPSKTYSAASTQQETSLKISSAKGSTNMGFDDPATLQTLKEYCPGASAEFYMAQLEKNATIGDAMKAHSSKLAADLEEAKKVKVEPAKPAASGVPAAVAETRGGSDAESDPLDFNALVYAYMDKHPDKTRMEAIVAVCRTNPEAHKAYVESNPKNQLGQVKRKINDRFEVSAAWDEHRDRMSRSSAPSK